MDLVFTFIGHLGAANRAYLFGNDEDFSKTQLRRKTAYVLTEKARLLPTRPIFVGGAEGFLGGNVFFSYRLFGVLHVDFEKIRSMLRWLPLCSIDEALKITAQYFQQGKKL
ncbi:hypothetical protein H7698_03350 [Pseudomonas sp. p50]|uniref:hypothetical protein n=1 Tax=Pseudomonas sp. p50(2008) TaxID=2816832 RepID=UPI00188D5159|nr:hypothetical protein [Pseudomonas sp. p50(2008)]MBF4555093.1 hypothetical protein [Pseudomonas sp. p50(2008)]